MAFNIGTALKTDVNQLEAAVSSEVHSSRRPATPPRPVTCVPA
jgi:hypothetical protein